jgi:hypothetical protein
LYPAITSADKLRLQRALSSAHSSFTRRTPLGTADATAKIDKPA